MKKRTVLLAFFISASLSVTHGQVSQDEEPHLYFTAQGTAAGVRQSDMAIYTVTLNDHVLYFCDGCLYNSLVLKSCTPEGETIYMEQGDKDKKSVTLPKELKGEYELQLHYDKYYLYTYITL